MDSEQTTVDPGPGGFLSILGNRAEAAAQAAAADLANEADAVPPTEPAAADPDSPEEPDGDLSAEELVAARLAAAAEADGIAPPDEDEAEAPAAATAEPEADDALSALLAEPEGEPSLDQLTPEQLRALAEDAIRLKAEAAARTREDDGRKVAEAEAEAIARVQAEYDRDVVAVADRHYSAVYQERLATLIAESTEEELPARAAALFQQVTKARQAWEDEQAALYDERARQAALEARLKAPAFRQYAAERLVTEAGLPATAVAKVLEEPDTRRFEARVKELVEIRDGLLAVRQQNQQKQRQEARLRLLETTPRTAPTGSPPGGKPREYRGTADEGAALLKAIRQGA